MRFRAGVIQSGGIVIIQSDRLNGHSKVHREAGICDLMNGRTADSIALTSTVKSMPSYSGLCNYLNSKFSKPLKTNTGPCKEKVLLTITKLASAENSEDTAEIEKTLQPKVYKKDNNPAPYTIAKTNASKDHAKNQDATSTSSRRT